ncbi:MAG: hypothetical protein LUF01_14535 [Bacteroides sp.]|nr:hypothetical protein [Bacteroides sp.]
MKTLKTLGLLIFVAINFSSCRYTDEPKFIVYNLGLSFQDASGNDLVKGIGLEEWSASTSMENALWGSVDPDLYVLDIIVSEPCNNWDNEIYNSPARPGFSPTVHRLQLAMERNYNSNCYLTNSFGFPVGDCPEEKILTYKLKSPYVFGDDATHEFVTYWDIPKIKKAPGTENFAKCYRIEFEGTEIIPQSPTDKKKELYGYYNTQLLTKTTRVK